MGTLVRSKEAAELLNVSTATLYAYVSRGRLGRTTAPDGRSSLFERDEVERLAARSRRASSGPRPTIDVQIASVVTVMSETTLHYRGHEVSDLVSSRSFEDIAELLWSDHTAAEAPSGTVWPAADRSDVTACSPIPALPVSDIGRLAIAAHVLDGCHPHDDATTAARRLLLGVPPLLGTDRRTGRFALRLTRAWRRRPEPALVDAVDIALGLLADHELATSTLAVRVAASVRASPYVAIAAGLAAVEGPLHGSASGEAHSFLDDCAARGPKTVVAERLRGGLLVPGFGHKVYRGIDPRFEPMMRAVRPLDPDGTRFAVVERTIAEVGRVLPHQPNIDLALGAMTWIAGLDADTPIFAVARIAGWAAHYHEEIEAPPVRFRGVART